MLYLIDSSVLIDASRSFYQFSRVPEFWGWIRQMTREGTVKIPQEIYNEINKKDDELSQWVSKYQEELILEEAVEFNDIQQVISEGYSVDYFGASDVDLESLGADPYLIAHALFDRENRVVVTREVSKPKRKRTNRHIPDVCTDFDVSCIDSVEFITKLDFSTNWAKPSRFELLPDHP